MYTYMLAAAIVLVLADWGRYVKVMACGDA